MAKKTQEEKPGKTAFVLTHANSVEPQHIPGLRGRWQLDVPVIPESIGYTVTELADLISDMNLPIKRVIVPSDEVEDGELVGAGTTVARGGAE